MISVAPGPDRHEYKSHYGQAFTLSFQVPPRSISLQIILIQLRVTNLGGKLSVASTAGIILSRCGSKSTHVNEWGVISSLFFSTEYRVQSMEYAGRESLN